MMSASRRAHLCQPVDHDALLARLGALDRLAYPDVDLELAAAPRPDRLADLLGLSGGEPWLSLQPDGDPVDRFLDDLPATNMRRTPENGREVHVGELDAVRQHQAVADPAVDALQGRPGAAAWARRRGEH